MATITAGDFRNGKTFEMDGKIMQVVEFQHVKPGKGAAFVRTKMKNIVTGAVTETSFNPTAKFEEAFVERKDMAYSYNDGDLYYFMDQETFDMIPLGKDLLGDAFRFVTENTVCKVLSYKGKRVRPGVPELHGARGHRDGARLWPATPPPTPSSPPPLRPAPRCKVPLFINIGDKIRDRHPHRRVSVPRQVSNPPVSALRKEHKDGNFPEGSLSEGSGRGSGS